MSTKDAPPYWPVTKGKRQTLPKPMAQPAEIRINPKREEKLSRSIIHIVSLTNTIIVYSISYYPVFSKLKKIKAVAGCSNGEFDIGLAGILNITNRYNI